MSDEPAILCRGHEIEIPWSCYCQLLDNMFNHFEIVRHETMGRDVVWSGPAIYRGTVFGLYLGSTGIGLQSENSNLAYCATLTVSTLKHHYVDGSERASPAVNINSTGSDRTGSFALASLRP